MIRTGSYRRREATYARLTVGKGDFAESSFACPQTSSLGSSPARQRDVVEVYQSTKCVELVLFAQYQSLPTATSLNRKVTNPLVYPDKVLAPEEAFDLSPDCDDLRPWFLQEFDLLKKTRIPRLPPPFTVFLGIPYEHCALRNIGNHISLTWFAKELPYRVMHDEVIDR